MTLTSDFTQRWVLLAVVGIGLFMVALDITVLYTALPTLARELQMTSEQGLWVINAYPLVTAGLLLGAGTLGDRIGHRTMYLVGLLIFGMASLMAGFSELPSSLIAARVIQAIGAAAMMPSTLALIRIAFEDEHERNIAISVWASLSLIGAVLGPLVGGLLLERFWWGTIFLVNVPIVAIAIVGTLCFAAQSRPNVDTSRPWDWLSSLQILVALSSLVALIKQLAAPHTSWPLILLFAGLAAVGGTLFTRRQSRLAYPLLDFSLFRNRAFGAGVFAAACVTFAMSGLLLSIAQRYQWIEGFTALEAGLLVSALFLGSLPSGILGGFCLRRIGLRWLMSGGLAVGGLGIAVSLLGLKLGLVWLVVGLIVSGTGLGATISVASNAIIGNAPTHRAGMAASVEEVSYEFGSLLSVAVLGSLLTGLYSGLLVLPEGASELARQGIAEALAIARQPEAENAELLAAAVSAYDQAYQVVMGFAAVMLLIGSLVTGSVLHRYGPGATASVVPH